MLAEHIWGDFFSKVHCMYQSQMQKLRVIIFIKGFNRILAHDTPPMLGYALNLRLL